MRPKWWFAERPVDGDTLTWLVETHGTAKPLSGSSPSDPQVRRARTLLRYLFARLPEPYRVLLQWRAQGLHQRQIAERLGTSQAAVSERLATALDAARWAAETLPAFSGEQVEAWLREQGERAPMAHTAGLYWVAWSTAEVSRQEGCRQGRVWQRLEAVISRRKGTPIGDGLAAIMHRHRRHGGQKVVRLDYVSPHKKGQPLAWTSRNTKGSTP